MDKRTAKSVVSAQDSKQVSKKRKRLKERDFSKYFEGISNTASNVKAAKRKKKNRPLIINQIVVKNNPLPMKNQIQLNRTTH